MIPFQGHSFIESGTALIRPALAQDAGAALPMPVRAWETRKKEQILSYLLYGAGDEARTRYLHLGKVALYQMSYARNGHGLL